MQIVLIGISHKQAPIQIREKISFTFTKRIEAMKELKEEDIEEILLLSTCNRTEVIAATNNPERSIDIIRLYFKIYAGGENLAPYLVIKKDEEAIRHIYRVTCGLDSLVVGEDQILGQVKEALKKAQEIGCAKKYLSKVVREAISFSKKMRGTYTFSENPLSIGSLGVKFLKEQVGELNEKKILIIGTGKMGGLVMKYLQEEGVNQIFIANRTHARVESILQNSRNIIGVEYEERYDLLPEMDILVSGTSSPHKVIKKEELPSLKKPLFILDLAVPRDVEASVKEIKEIFLYTIDDLQMIADANIQYRKSIAIIIENEIENELKEICTWIQQAQVDPAIAQMNYWQQKIIKETMDLLSDNKNFGISEKKHLEALMNTSIKRVMKVPIKQLKALEEPQQIEKYAKMIDYLFKE